MREETTQYGIPRTLLFTRAYIGRHENVTNVARERGLSLRHSHVPTYSGAHKRSDANTLFSCGFYIC